MQHHWETYESNVERNYGKNYIWCDYKCISGDKFFNLFYSFALYTIPLVWYLFVLFRVNDSKDSSYPVAIVTIMMYLISIFAMLRGGFTDPGIWMRQKEKLFWNPKKSLVRQVKNGHLINLAFCYTCFLFRPPRTSHCAACDNCVERFDHHCIWWGTCIGKRNYKFFYLWITSLNITALFEIFYSVYFIVYHVRQSKQTEVYDNLSIIWLGFVIFFDWMFVLFFWGKLEIWHTWWVYKNLTFYEYFKKKYANSINPFFKSVWQHCYRWLIKFTPRAFWNLKQTQIMETNINVNEVHFYDNYR